MQADLISCQAILFLCVYQCLGSGWGGCYIVYFRLTCPEIMYNSTVHEIICTLISITCYLVLYMYCSFVFSEITNTIVWDIVLF